MFKVLLITAVLAMVAARPQEGHGHGHGHAYSSQNIVLHHEPHHHEAHVPHQEHHEVLVHQPHQEHQQHHGHNANHHEHQHVDYYSEPKYEFAYEIKDPHTHDIKQQHEHRNGDVVTGEYSLYQPDGTVRIVKYHADHHTGFHANVKYEGHAQHVVPEHH